MFFHSGEYKTLSRECVNNYLRETLTPEELKQHAAKIRMKNVHRRNDLRRLLEHEGLKSTDNSLIVAEFGSGGRDECGPDSRADLVVYGDTESAAFVSSMVADFSSRYRGLVYEIDSKIIGNDSLLYYKNDSKNPRPTRVLDSNLILSNSADELKLSLRQQLIQEVKKSNNSLLKVLRTRAKDFRKVTESGKQRFGGKEVVQFDLNAGVQFYNPTEYLGGVKYGPMRFLQSQLVLDVVRILRSYDDPTSFLRGVPNSTTDKLRYLESEGLMHDDAKSSLEDLITCYNYCLWLYHKVQFLHSYDSSVMECELSNPQELKDMFALLVKVTSGTLLKEDR